MGAQSNKGERGQRNREEIETGATIFLADSLLIREGTFFIVGGGGGGPGYFRFFCEKSRGPPTPWNGLMHDPSEISKQKHHAHYSSDSVGGTSAAGKSESASSERWKDLGWFPNPKGEYTEFSNSILPKFYLSFWTTCPYKERFRHCFVTERKRQWEVREA